MSYSDQLIHQYRLLNDWFSSVLDGVSDAQGKATIDDQTNSLEWIAGHLLVGRYRNLLRLAVQIEAYPHLNIFANLAIPPPNAIPFNKDNPYPAISESRAQWQNYAEILMNRLLEKDETILSTKLPFSVPTGGDTVLDALVFAVMHESYHIGQMSMIRKIIGLPAMQLTRRAKVS